MRANYDEHEIEVDREMLAKALTELAQLRRRVEELEQLHKPGHTHFEGAW